MLGVLGRALKEHVFGAQWFGGSTKEIKELDSLKMADRQSDGMYWQTIIELLM